MKLVVDALDDSSGFVGSVAGVTAADNLVRDYIAANQTASVFIHYDGNATLNEDATLTFGSAIDVSAFDELVLHLFSFRKRAKGRELFRKPSDYNYSLELATGGPVFLIPTRSRFTDVTVDLTQIPSIEFLRFTALHPDEDYLGISYAVAVKDELPRDLYDSFIEEYDYVRDNIIPDLSANNGRLLESATFAGAAGAETIDLTGLDFLQAGAVIRIEEGATIERHQLDERNDESTFYMNSNLDGPTLVNTFTAADVILELPAVIGMQEQEIQYPSVRLWGFSPTPLTRSAKAEFLELGSDSVDDFTRVRHGQQLSWPITLDCVGMHGELLADVARIVRTVLARNVLWINGRKHDILYTEGATEIEPGVSFNIIGQVQYTVLVGVREDVYFTDKAPEANAAVLTSTPRAASDTPLQVP